MAPISIIVFIKIHWTNDITRAVGTSQKINRLWVDCVNAKILFLYIEFLFLLEAGFVLHSLGMLWDGLS